MSNKPIIGVLALQGAVELHRPHIEAAGGSFMSVKTPTQFEEVDGFILPGGESTTMLNLIERFKLWEPLADQFSKKPVWGICAGSILLAQEVVNPAQKSFGVLPMTVRRNGYGRQLDSHHGLVEGFEVSFIRAPIIEGVNDNIEVIAREEGEDYPIWVRSGSYMATTFHPELTKAYPSPMHQRFVDLVQESA